jgi:hypothetical protein
MNNTQTLEEAALKVAMWWSEKSFHTPLNQNNGDDSATGGMMFPLMNMIAQKAQMEITKEKQKAFEDHLVTLLMNCPEYDRNLDVDYTPCTILTQAADFAGIDTKCFPCKSHTRIDKNNRAFGKFQYGKSEIEL